MLQCHNPKSRNSHASLLLDWALLGGYRFVPIVLLALVHITFLDNMQYVLLELNYLFG